MTQIFYQSNSVYKSKKLMQTSLFNWFNNYPSKVVAKNRALKNDFNFSKSFFAMLSLLTSSSTQNNRHAMAVCRAFIGIIFLSFTSSFNTVAALPDLSVSTTISNQSPVVGADIIYTIKVKNINPDKATGVELTNTLPAGVTFKSFNVNGVGTATTTTASGVTSVVWNVGEVAGSTELTMIVVATVTKRGFWYNIAEITKETEQDTDSTPSNHLILEDDQDGTCFSIEEFFYTGDEHVTQIPTGFTNIVWTKKVGATGTPVIVTSTTPDVTLLADGNIRITNVTDYTEYAFTATNGRCPVNGCCAFKFTPGLFGSIGSIVWNDVDGNSIKNTSETGINGITVELYDATDNTLLATDVTANGGKYLFSNLMSGSYKVKFILPTGRSFVTPNAPGSNSTNDSDAGVGGFSNTIAIDVTKPAGDVGRDNLTIDAGIVANCIIGTGTLTTTTPSICLPAAGGQVVLAASTGVSPVAPAGFSVNYILTKGSTNTIQQISNTPSFSVALPDAYKIFTLVYNANSSSSNYLNLSNIIFGVTKASDLATTINTSSTICAQLDATGVSFNVNTTPAAPFILGTTICSGGTVTLGTPGVTDPVFQWFTSATATTPFATTSSITVSPSVTTTYFLSIVNSSATACPSEKASVTVAVNPKPATPTVRATLTNNCAINATSVNLADAITSTVSTGGTFEWHTANSTTSPVISNPTAIGAGSYFLFEKSSNGCYSDGAMVVVNITTCQCTNPPAVSLTALLPICGGTSTPVQLNAILSGGATSGVWTTDGTGTFDNAASLTAKYTPSAADVIDGSIILSFKTNDPDGAIPLCNAALANTILTIKAKPAAPVNLKSDTLICLGSSTKLFAVSAGNTIKWYSSATSTTPIGIGSDLGFSVTPTIEGTVTYFAEATSAEGCVSDRTSISFKVSKCFTDLAVVKTVISSPDARTSPSYLLGQEISYTIDARNIGNINADNVTLTDILPQGATFVSAIPAGQYNSSTGVWNVGSLSEGSNKILLINVKLSKIGAVVNTATITGTNDDPSKLANNTSSVTVNVVERADLSLAKSVSNSIPHVGDTLTYSLNVNNAGPNTATNVEVKDALPSGLAFLSSSDVTHSSGVVTGVVASIASGSSKQFSFKVKVLSAGNITNSAEITKSDQPDPDSTPGNGTNNNEDDRSTVSITVTEVCNLTAPVITATNSVICLNGQTTLTATGCTGSTIVWSSGQTNVASITVSPTVSRTYTAYCQKDACQSPASNVMSITVTNIAVPTLIASQSTICSGESSVLTASGCSGVIEWQVAGLPTGNTLTVTPSSSQTFTAKCKASSCESALAAINIIVTQKPNAPDILAEKTEICPSESITLTALNCNGAIRWNTGQTTTTILVTPTVSTSYSAVCTINGCISNASASKVINVVPIPAPTIRTTAASVCPGGSLTLTADGCNGTVTWYYDDKTATGASLTVTPTKSTSYAVTCSTAFCTSIKSVQTVITVENPAIPVITSATSNICLGSAVQLTATGCSGTVNWSDGQKGAIVSVSPTVTTAYTATCSIGLCTSAASLIRTITVTSASAPVITSDKTTICLGQAITLSATGCAGTIRWSDGTTGLPKVIVPTANIKYTATCESSPCISPQSNELSFIVNTTPSIVSPVTTNTIIATGATADLTKLVTSTPPTGTTLVFKTTSSPTTNTVLTPTAVGIGTYYAFYQSADGCYSAGTRIIVYDQATVADADVAIKIDADRTLAKLNENINFLISVTNNGPSTARNIIITNPLPAGLEFVSSSNGLTVSGDKIVISFDSLMKDQVRTFAYVGKMKGTATIINPASVTSLKDPNLTNNSSSVTINGENADLSLIKTVSNLTPHVGDTLTYTLTVNNAGPNTATNVEVKDIIPAGMVFVSSTNTTHTSGVITGTSVSIPSGSSQVFTYKVKVLTAGTFTSAAEITKSDQPDPDSTPANGTNNNEDDKSSVTITVTELCNLVAPVITSDKTTICLGQAITLSATGCVGTIRWSDGTTGLPKIIVPNANIKYSATCESLSCISPQSNELSFVVNTTSNIVTPVTINSTIAVGATADLTKLVTSTAPTGTTLVFKTTSSPTTNTVLTPTAVGIGTYYAFYQSTEGCYSAGARIIVDNGTTTPSADVAITIVSDKATAKLNENINFTISVKNNGPNTARNIVISNPFPAGIDLILIPAGLTISGGKIVINLDSLEKDQTKTFTYVAKMKVTTAVTNPASVSSFNDTNPANNNSSVTVNGEITTVDSCRVGLAMAVTNTVSVSSGVYNVTYQLIAKNFCKDTLKNVSLTNNLATTFKTPTSAIIIKKPTLGAGSKLTVNNNFGLLDSNIVNSATSYMLPGAVDTVTYIVQVTTNGETGPFNSQAQISGKRPTNEVLTAKSSNGTNVNANPSVTQVTLGNSTTIIGLAKELVSAGLKRVSQNVWTVPYRIKVVNMGTNNITRLNVRDSLGVVFVAKGATIVTKPTLTTTKAGIAINPNYNGIGANSNLLVDSLSSLAKGDSAIINLTVTINVAAATDSVFNNVAIGTGLGSDNKSYTDVSTNGTNPDGNGDLNPSNDNVATPVVLTKGASNVKASIGVSLSAVTDTSPQSDGSYNVTMTLIAKNYGNVLLKDIALSNDLTTTIGSQVAAWSILGRPTLVRGANAALNLKFNGRLDSLLTVDSTTALLPGDSIVIQYTINITKNVLIDTLHTNAYAKAMTEDNLTQVTDSSVNGENPDPNNDGNPLESSPTPIIIPNTTPPTKPVSIPHGFSPNGDGVNDTFVIDGVNSDERAAVEVYNRWGSLVYVSEDYKNDWDARPNTGVSLIEKGMGLPSGTYFYKVTIYKRATGEKVALPAGVEPVRYMTISR
ncbi:SdrD B-like domain-containing protein [Arcicella sp. BE140]|uniref:Ig-like domain-containing protein n=2 Tax=Arcicella TaxID=217140 RepID=UPI00285FB246|nr:SdrD B-like domain-containing protein [Arcicella sp. BE140]MDR6560248.1 putative repeat protein (TIGR01451 family)/gliding motility-associated-like protein [Arcicella sp. BE51]MDR6821495.1 putative repeat protein (TIGR01451 family)/gliding motility-associated-like protein [Arcicella sp. BE139]